MSGNPAIKIISSLIDKVQRVNLQSVKTGRITTKEVKSLKLPSKELAYRHVTGSIRIGLYPEVENGKITFGAVDLDLKEEPEEKRQFYTLEIYKKLVKLGFRPFIEKSKSKGYHVWIFFSEPVKKETLRWILEYVVNTSSYPNKRLLEVFPKGTALFLPMFNSFNPDESLKKEFLREKKNAVLKPENFNQYFSNWTSLFEEYAVENTKTIELLEKLKNLPPCFLRAYENWKEGSRNGYACGLAGVCKKILNISEEEAEEIILAIAEAKGDEELKLRKTAVYRTYEQDKPAGCSILKGKNAEITVAVPVCDGDCEVIKRLKERDKPRQIITLSKFYPEPFAKEILNRFSFWYEGEKQEFWFYDKDEGIWKNKAKDFIRDFLYKEKLLDPTIKKNHQVNEIVEYVKYSSFHKGKPLPEPSPFLIPFKNGVYDLENDIFRDFRKEDYFTFKLPWSYKEEAECPLIDSILCSLVPKERVIDLYELIAYCLWRGYPYHKFFIIYGKGSNGKSLYGKILTTFLGKHNISEVSLEELQKGGFYTISLYKKLANITGEVSYDDLKNTRLIKQLTGEDYIFADRKNKEPISFQNYAKLIFLTNQVPISHDTTYAFFRRVFLIEFPYQFTGSKADKTLEWKLKNSPEEFEGLAYKSIQVLKELLNRGFTFTNDPNPEEIRKTYERLSNPITQFIDEFCIKDPEGYIWKYEFAEKLNEWLEKKGFTKLSNEVIGKRMKNLGYEAKQIRVSAGGENKRYWAWIGIKWKDDKHDSKLVTPVTTCDNLVTGETRCVTYTNNTSSLSLSQVSQVGKGQSFKEYKEQPQTTCDTCDTCDIPPEVEADFIGNWNSDEEISEWEELEKELEGEKEENSADAPKGYIFSDSEAVKAIEELQKTPVLYLDIETYSEELPKDRKDEPALDPFRNQVRLISLGDGEHFYTFDVQKLNSETINAVLELISEKLIVGHNLKFDLKTLAAKYGTWILPKKTFDTYIAERLIWNAKHPQRPPKGALSLSALAEKYTGRKLDKTEQTSDFGKDLTESQITYALEDIRVLPEIAKKQVEILNDLIIGKSKNPPKPNEFGLRAPVVKLEMAFLPVLVEIELAGIPVNADYLKEELQKNRKTFEKFYTEIKTKYLFDPQSPKQLLSFLKNRLGLEIESTSNKELVKHKDNEVVEKIIQLRKAKKKADLIEKYLSLRNGRLYPEFNQLEAHSGRMSCRNPNVQQVPRDIKGNFYKAPQGRAIIKADYPAIELRLASVVAPDKTMIEAFKAGKDLHKFTASLISGKPLEEVTKEERQRAKALNFGFIYGMSAETFREYAFTNYGVELSKEEAEEFRRKFFEAYSGIAEWHRKTADRLNLSDTGQITVLTRLKRPVAVNKLTNALNSPVQGSGADMLKMASVFFSRAVKEEGIDAQIINLVHDEIVVECSEKDKEKAKELLKEAMEKACSKLIPDFTTEVETEEVSCEVSG
ncbi:DNA polymerase [Desulfurobacterium crinifex]